MCLQIFFISLLKQHFLPEIENPTCIWVRAKKSYTASSKCLMETLETPSFNFPVFNCKRQ